MSTGELTRRVDPGWLEALAPVEAELASVLDRLQVEQHEHGVLPPLDRVLRAFEQPFENVRVLIVGQDPYPTPGHAIGLAFAVESHVRPLPRSLRNIHLERQSDLGLEPPEHGDLSEWAEHGVLLLNRVLSVRPGVSGSHHGIGWEAITSQAVRALVARGGPLVAILWGRQAQSLRSDLADVAVIESAHPSPLSARTGFFGSRPFSRANALLQAQGAPPIEWTITGRS